MTEVSTSLQRSSFEFTVSFDGVSGFPAAMGAFTESPVVSFGGCTWAVRLYPGGDTPNSSNSGVASCFLVKRSGGDCRASFTFAIKDQPSGSATGTETYCAVGSFTDLEPKRGFSAYISMHSLRGPGGVARQRNDLLTIKVFLTVYGEMQLLDSAPERSKKRKWDSYEQTGSAGSLQHARTVQGTSTSSALAKDLLKLFGDDAFSDVKIITSNKQKIKAHKLVLSARSEVFKTMLCGQMSESQNNEIMLIDFEPAVVRSFVRYLYEDTLADDVLHDSVVDLYAMARKYHVVGLESLCEEYMGKEMDGSSVFNLLDLAELHDSPILRMQCLNYISENGSELVMEKEFMNHLDAYCLRRETPSTRQAAAAAPASPVAVRAPAPASAPAPVSAPSAASSSAASSSAASSSAAEASKGKKKKQKTSDNKTGTSSAASAAPANATATATATGSSSSSSSSSSSTAVVVAKSPNRSSHSSSSSSGHAAESEAEALRTRRRRDVLMVLAGIIVNDLPSLSAAERTAIEAIDNAVNMLTPRDPAPPAHTAAHPAAHSTTGPLRIGESTCTCDQCVAERRQARIDSAVATAAAFNAAHPAHPPGYCASCRTVHDDPIRSGLTLHDDDEDDEDEDYDDLDDYGRSGMDHFRAVGEEMDDEVDEDDEDGDY